MPEALGGKGALKGNEQLSKMDNKYHYGESNG